MYVLAGFEVLASVLVRIQVFGDLKFRSIFIRAKFSQHVGSCGAA
jgi:hypothetical protein